MVAQRARTVSYLSSPHPSCLALRITLLIEQSFLRPVHLKFYLPPLFVSDQIEEGVSVALESTVNGAFDACGKPPA